MFAKILIANRGEIASASSAPQGGSAWRPWRSIPMPTGGALHVEMADEAVHIGPLPAAESYLSGERIHRGGESHWRRSHPSRLWLPLGEPGFRGAVEAAGLASSAPRQGHPCHGAQGCRQAADGKGGRARGARLSRRSAGTRRSRRQGQRDRLSRADQGAGGRRRQGACAASTMRPVGRCAGGSAARGQGRLRRRPGAGREADRQAAPTSRFRYLATITAMSSTSSNATARPSAGTRR